MTNNQDTTEQKGNIIIIEGERYTEEELSQFYKELLNPTPATPPTPDNFDFKKAFFLEDNEFGRAIHNAIQTKYSGIEAITKIPLGKGSNPFYVVAVNEALRELSRTQPKYSKIRTATQADLEKVLKDDLLELKEHYEDSGLVLRTREEPNKYFAEDLFNQFKTQGNSLKKNSAYVLWLHNLLLRKDTNFPHKLSFVLPNAFSDYFEAPILNETSQQTFDSSDIDFSKGIPKKLSASGTRKLYTRNWKDYSIKNSGLVGFCLDWGLLLDSNYECLGGSGDDGRVVLVSAEGDAL